MKLLHLAGILGIGMALGCGKTAPQGTALETEAKAVTLPIDSPKVVIPVADGFDFPVGPPDAKKYYNAQGFGKNLHLGDDWNGIGGGNTDLGDPVFAIADGKVEFAEDNGAGWGNVLLVQHNIGTEAHPKLIESLYAHLDTMLVDSGVTVKRGQQIGTIGDAHGAYAAHLHFEIRSDIHLPVGGGYGEDTAGYLDPTWFIKTHRVMNNE